LPKESCGLLLHRRRGETVVVLLVHPGGPFWARKDDGAWSIPKGEKSDGEDARATARREFGEEVGPVPAGPLVPLGTVRQSGGKIVEAFALEGDFDIETLESNSFEIEWPPHSGEQKTFPEVDRAGWFTLDEARVKLLASQRPLLDRIEALYSG
jgi:predicted NUDIX family NTP pyrophosphohydrolase